MMITILDTTNEYKIARLLAYLGSASRLPTPASTFVAVQFLELGSGRWWVWTWPRGRLSTMLRLTRNGQVTKASVTVRDVVRITLHWRTAHEAGTLCMVGACVPGTVLDQDHAHVDVPCTIKVVGTREVE